jgi:hypothetical protein
MPDWSVCHTFETATFAEGEEDVVAVRKLGHFKHQLLRRYEGSIRAVLRLFQGYIKALNYV